MLPRPPAWVVKANEAYDAIPEPFRFLLFLLLLALPLGVLQFSGDVDWDGEAWQYIEFFWVLWILLPRMWHVHSRSAQ